MVSAISMDSTHMALFRALNRHFCTPSSIPSILLHHRLKCLSHHHAFRTSSSFPPSSSLRSLCAIVSRFPCRFRCVSSSASPFSSSGAGNGGGGGFSGGGGGGGDYGDSNVKLVGDGGTELSSLSPDVIILDVAGMVCGGCAANVKRILESRPQVSYATVNLTTETAIVWPVSEAKTVPNWQKQLGEALAEHLSSCGFKSSLRVAGQKVATDAVISPF